MQSPPKKVKGLFSLSGGKDSTDDDVSDANSSIKRFVSCFITVSSQIKLSYYSVPVPRPIPAHVCEMEPATTPGSMEYDHHGETAEIGSWGSDIVSSGLPSYF